MPRRRWELTLGIGRLSLERAPDTVTGGTCEQDRLEAFEGEDHRLESKGLLARRTTRSDLLAVPVRLAGARRAVTLLFAATTGAAGHAAPSEAGLRATVGRERALRGDRLATRRDDTILVDVTAGAWIDVLRRPGDRAGRRVDRDPVRHAAGAAGR